MHCSALCTLNCTDWQTGTGTNGDPSKPQRYDTFARGYLDIAAREGNSFPTGRGSWVMPHV